MTTLTLYSYEACPYAQRTQMTLLEKGIDFELVEVDLYDRPDWWADLSPYGKVPLLKDGDGIVFESAIINQYIEESFPGPVLLPTDPLERAHARIWMDYCDSRFMAACHQLIADRRNEEQQVANREKLRGVFRYMENGLREMGGGPFWMGKQFTLVDIQFTPFFERFACYQDLWAAEWPEDCLLLQAWFDEMQSRPSHQQTRHDVAFHIERYRKYDQAA